MHTFQDWLNKMAETDKMKVKLANIWYDWLSADNSDRLKPRLSRYLFKAVLAAWDPASADEQVRDPWHHVVRVTDVRWKTYRGRGRVLEREEVEKLDWSTIMKAVAFNDTFLVKGKRDLGGGIDTGSDDIARQGFDDVQDIVERLIRGSGAREYPRKRKYLGWVTKASCVEQARVRYEDRTTEFADAVRNRHGLDKLTEAATLIEVVIPGPALSQVKVSRPTVLDARHAGVFQSHCGKSFLGRTANVKSGRQGIPEAVHTPLPCGTFRPRVVGNTSNRRMNPKFAVMLAGRKLPPNWLASLRVLR